MLRCDGVECVQYDARVERNRLTTVESKKNTGRQADKLAPEFFFSKMENSSKQQLGVMTCSTRRCHRLVSVNSSSIMCP